MQKYNIEWLAGELLNPRAGRFWVQRDQDVYKFGHAESQMLQDADFDWLTFDISNNRALANMDTRGSVKFLTLFRDTYRANESPAHGWPGVWLHKDFACFGPYTFKLRLNQETYDLAAVDWPAWTGFFDNIFPLTELRGPQVTVRLIAYAPISAGGDQRPSGLVYGALVVNTSNDALAGAVILPEPHADRLRLYPAELNWKSYRGDDFEMGLLDSVEDALEVPFHLAPGETIWVPAAIYAPGEPFVEAINAEGSVSWFHDTWQFYRALLGDLSTPDDPFQAQFLERNILTCLASVGMDASGFISGSNWGSLPTTFAIWIKDMFYTCLPFARVAPALFQRMILWFAKYGVRHKGHVIKGGVQHSLSISLASILMSGLYYQNTGDKEFFLSQPHLQPLFENLVEQMLNGRKDQTVFLFSSDYLSDGKAYGDWHTGINICAWTALTALSRLMDEVYAETRKAGMYAELADRTRRDIETRCRVQGPLGEMYTEGVFAGGKAALLFSDGEESDTTLMPYYGYCSPDDPAYQNSMRFAMSEANIAYNPLARCLRWNADPAGYPGGIPATAPGYMKGIAASASAADLRAPAGALDSLRRIADADGALWWWPYGGLFPGGPDKPQRGMNSVGKSGWASGVYSVLFVERFFGLSYDAPCKALSFRPLGVDHFTWERCRLGSCTFSIAYLCAQGQVSIRLHNLNPQPLDFAFQVPGDSGSSLKINGETHSGQLRAGRYYDHLVVWGQIQIPPDAKIDISVAVTLNSSVEEFL